MCIYKTILKPNYELNPTLTNGLNTVGISLRTRAVGDTRGNFNFSIFIKKKDFSIWYNTLHVTYITYNNKLVDYF